MNVGMNKIFYHYNQTEMNPHIAHPSKLIIEF